MKLDNISINNVIQETESLLEKDESLSPAIKSTIKMLLMIIMLLTNRLGLNSKNSSKPPSDDKNRKRGSNREKSNKKPGGQNGHIGTNLKKVSTPDKIEKIKIDRKTLPKSQYKAVGFESRQVFDIEINQVITEYQAEILEDPAGNRFVATFPEHVKNDVQYGVGSKVNAVYMSQFQLLPYKRIQDQFADQMHMPLSTGSIFNFNKEAYDLLEQFEEISKQRLSASKLMHADETGINVDKKRIWLHSASNDLWTHFYPHEKRGSEAMDAIGIIPRFDGVLCHDHWKPYYRYTCQHALCNAHHLRELTFAYEQDDQQWAKPMSQLLIEINQSVDDAGGKLNRSESDNYRKRYRELLATAEIECPPPEQKREKGKRGRIKKSKSRNLLERFINFEDDVLRFMETDFVPFTNNLGENDLRMTKVQQKISGCFRSMEGAYIFCRIRGYLSTCRKHDMNATEALTLLFQGKLPNFVDSS